MSKEGQLKSPEERASKRKESREQSYNKNGYAPGHRLIWFLRSVHSFLAKH